MKHKIKNLYWYGFLIIYLEIMYRIFIFNTFLNIDILYLILFSIPIIIFFYLITNIFNEKVNRILVILLSLIITIIFMAQAVYFNFYQSMFSFFSLMNGTGQVMAFAQDILKIMLGIWYVLVLMFVPFILFLIFNKKMFSFKRLKFRKSMIYLILMIIFYLSTLLAVKLDNKGNYSLNTLYAKTHAPMITAKKLGLLTMTRYDLVRFIFGFEEKTEVEDIKPVEIVKEIKYNMLDIDFDELLETETNENIKKMHEYFKGVTPTKQNDYTGMFKDKNLIFITAEGFDTLAVNEELTPTLYKMANNSFVFKNFYQPLYPVSTSDGEYLNMTGLIPKEGVWSMYRSSFTYQPFAIGNIFKSIGYKTMAYHNNEYKYYDRHLSHPNMGFTYIGCGNGLQKRMNCKQWPESDLDMIKVTLDDYAYNLKPVIDETVSSMVEEPKEEKKDIQHFATYYMTVSGHLNYSRMGNSMSSKHWSEVKNLPYSEAVKAYIACNMEFDKAMEYLLQKLDEYGILDDTVIVISPDHYPYGLKNERKEMSSIVGYDRTDKFENYRTTFILYNSAITEPIEVTKYTTSIDIIPTVYNLFGLSFDSRLFMGRDMLSDDEEGLVILSDRSWISDKGTYNSIKGVFKPFEKEITNEQGEIEKVPVEVPEGYVEEVTAKANARFRMSNLILSNDYYNHIGLNKNEENTEE